MGQKLIQHGNMRQQFKEFKRGWCGQERINFEFIMLIKLGELITVFVNRI
jgi:hypothetical protein